MNNKSIMLTTDNVKVSQRTLNYLNLLRTTQDLFGDIVDALAEDFEDVGRAENFADEHFAPAIDALQKAITVRLLESINGNMYTSDPDNTTV